MLEVLDGEHDVTCDHTSFMKNGLNKDINRKKQNEFAHEMKRLAVGLQLKDQLGIIPFVEKNFMAFMKEFEQSHLCDDTNLPIPFQNSNQKILFEMFVTF